MLDVGLPEEDVEDDIVGSDDVARDAASPVRPPNAVAGAIVAPNAAGSGVGLPPPKGVGRGGVGDANTPPKAVAEGPNAELPKVELVPTNPVLDEPNVVGVEEAVDPNVAVPPNLLAKPVLDELNPLAAPNPLVVGVVDPNLIVESRGLSDPKVVGEGVIDVEEVVDVVVVLGFVLLISVETPKVGVP
jgi:hypothetical protein